MAYVVTDVLGARTVDRTPSGTVVNVSTTAGVITALAGATNGTTIVLAAGAYTSNGGTAMTKVLASGQNINVFAAVGASVTCQDWTVTASAGWTVRGITFTTTTALA